MLLSVGLAMFALGVVRWLIEWVEWWWRGSLTQPLIIAGLAIAGLDLLLNHRGSAGRTARTLFRGFTNLLSLAWRRIRGV